MSYSNGLLPSETTINKGQRGPPGFGFKITDDGNYDLEKKLMRNLECPPDVKDDDGLENIRKDMKSAVNKEYINGKFLKKDTNGNFFYLKQDAIKNTEPYYDGLFGDNDLVSKAFVDSENAKQLNIDGSNSMTSNLNINYNKVTNLSGGTDTSDAVNYGQLLQHKGSHQNNYHLRESSKFYKNYGDQAELTVQSIKIPNHDHHDLYVILKEGDEYGFGSGWGYVTLRATSNLPVGVYTALLEISSAIIDRVICFCR